VVILIVIMASKFKHPGLESMGYYFNDQLELRQLENDEPFKWQGQQHYDVLGDQVTEWIQDYMVGHYGMKEIWLGDAYPQASEDSEDENSAEEVEAGHVSKGKKVKEVVKDPLVWHKPSRSGVFTITDAELPRVTAEEMKKHAKVNVFISSDFYEADKLLVLVQGSGAVRPGQWARALCINHSLQAGTIFDYLDIARELGMATIVLNPNQSILKLRVKSEEEPLGAFSRQHAYPILGHEDHVKHILYVWDHFVVKSAAKDIWMVAHSRGGDSALQLLNHRLVHTSEAESAANGANAPATTESKIEPKVSTISLSDDAQQSDLQRKLRALAFTDSVHWIGSANSHAVLEWMEENARDWVASKNPLDTPEPSHKDTAGCDCFSSGHSKHEWTSPCAVNSVFKFFVSQAEPGSLNRWKERQISFSTPPQNMPATEAAQEASQASPASSPSQASDAAASPSGGHARVASYADVASGRASVKSSTSPVAEAKNASNSSSSTPSPSATPSASVTPKNKPTPTPKKDHESSSGNALGTNTAFFIGFGLTALAVGAAVAFFLKNKRK
jgi:hypothetical protein